MSMITIREAASILRLSTASVRRLIVSGKLGAYKVGGTYRIDVGHLSRFLNDSVAERPAETGA